MEEPPRLHLSHVSGALGGSPDLAKQMPSYGSRGRGTSCATLVESRSCSAAPAREERGVIIAGAHHLRVVLPARTSLTMVGTFLMSFCSFASIVPWQKMK